MRQMFISTCDMTFYRIYDKIYHTFAQTHPSYSWNILLKSIYFSTTQSAFTCSAFRWHQWRRSGVFIVVFLLLTLNLEMSTRTTWMKYHDSRVWLRKRLPLVVWQLHKINWHEMSIFLLFKLIRVATMWWIQDRLLCLKHDSEHDSLTKFLDPKFISMLT